MLDYDKLFNALLDEAENHRRQLPQNPSSEIWAARMAANHVLCSLAIALYKARP